MIANFEYKIINNTIEEMNSKSPSLLYRFSKLFYILLTGLILFSACKNNFTKIVGRTYIYEDSVYTLTVGFDKDTMYYIMKDARQPYFYKSPYELKKINDSDYMIEVPVKPVFWEKNNWEIVVTNSDGFYSKESGKYYKTYADSMLIKKGF